MKVGGASFTLARESAYSLTKPYWVYYHNYVIGELIAAQLRHYMESSITHGPFYLSESAGRFLLESFFGPGARDDWRDTVERATGEKLNPKHFAASLV